MLDPDNIRYLVVHCSASGNDDDIGASEIHELHQSFGWHGCGYHRVIRRDGSIEPGRPDYWIGAHVYGHNEESLGVCMVGSDQFTTAQFDALEDVLQQWLRLCPQALIVGHYNFPETEKTCPNFDVAAWCEQRSLPGDAKPLIVAVEAPARDPNIQSDQPEQKS